MKLKLTYDELEQLLKHVSQKRKKRRTQEYIMELKHKTCLLKCHITLIELYDWNCSQHNFSILVQI
jgi:hypothetical protein